MKPFNAKIMIEKMKLRFAVLEPRFKFLAGKIADMDGNMPLPDPTSLVLVRGYQYLVRHRPGAFDYHFVMAPTPLEIV